MTTALGEISVRRTYFHCEPCREGEYAVDRFLGIVGSLTRLARELACLAGIGCGFVQATRRLAKFCGWTVGASIMRQTCESEGKRVEDWRQGGGVAIEPPNASEPIPSPPAPCTPLVAQEQEESDEAADTESAETFPATNPDAVELPTAEMAAQFRKAEGLVEFFTDGASVNTWEGWREIRLALWQKRPLSLSAEPWEWSSRKLPPATARAVLIDMAHCEQFGPRWRPWLAALGVSDPSEISVLADGAEWIWRQVDIQYPDCDQVLDPFHAFDHFAEATRTIFDDKPGAMTAWLEIGRRWLIDEGWSGACRWVAAIRHERDHDSVSIEATEQLLGYLSKHTDRLDYRRRLAEGKSIGSGPVEGAVKQMVGRRLKQTGARWQPKNAIRMATLCSLEYAGDWDLYWHGASPKLAV